MSARKLVVYMAHPVSGDVEANLRNARAWLAFLVQTTEWSVCVSWMPYVEALAEAPFRERGLADDLAVLERCDAVVLVGGAMSPGMAHEREHADACGLQVADLLSIGREPPQVTERARIPMTSLDKALREGLPS